MKNKLNYILLIALCILVSVNLTNCHTVKSNSQPKIVNNNPDEDFTVFYEKFHNDTLFQVSRLKFPMGGMSIDGSAKTKWTRNNLPLMRTKIYDVDTSEYKVAIKKTKNTFTQKVWIEASEFSSEFRFERIHAQWYLVYVLDQNF